MTLARVWLRKKRSPVRTARNLAGAVFESRLGCSLFVPVAEGSNCLALAKGGARADQMAAGLCSARWIKRSVRFRQWRPGLDKCGSRVIGSRAENRSFATAVG